MFVDQSAAVGAAAREEIGVEPKADRSKWSQARYREVSRDLYAQLRTAHVRLHAAALKP
jgi:hypothetical protein